MCVPGTWRSKQQLPASLYMFSVLTDDTEVGGHCVGMCLIPRVYHVSTGDKLQSLTDSICSDSNKLQFI